MPAEKRILKYNFLGQDNCKYKYFEPFKDQIYF